jgi:SET domain-containing protein
MKTTRGPCVSVRDAGVMGRGVFAGRPIRKGGLVESCPVIFVTAADEERLTGTTLDRYLFAWGEGPEQSCLVLGLGSLYNHSAAPNAVACRVEGQSRMEFIALRRIEAGEQILIDYQWERAEYDFDPGYAASSR